MDCKLFDYAGENITIDKKIGGVLLDSVNYSTLNGLLNVQSMAPFRPLSDLTGEITLAYNAIGYRANYCMINYGSAETPYTKNYFITDRQLLTGGKMSLILRCDVLTTYRSGVREIPVVCRRTASGFQSPYIFDDRAPITTKRRVRQKENTSDLAAYSEDMILITVG